MANWAELISHRPNREMQFTYSSWCKSFLSGTEYRWRATSCPESDHFTFCDNKISTSQTRSAADCALLWRPPFSEFDKYRDKRPCTIICIGMLTWNLPSSRLRHFACAAVHFACNSTRLCCAETSSSRNDSGNLTTHKFCHINAKCKLYVSRSRKG